MLFCLLVLLASLSLRCLVRGASCYGRGNAHAAQATAFREKLLGMMITPSQQGSASELETVRTAQLAGFLRALGAGGR